MKQKDFLRYHELLFLFLFLLQFYVLLIAFLGSGDSTLTLKDGRSCFYQEKIS